MNYDNSSIRRADRRLDEASARRLLQESGHAVLCLQNLQGGGYGVPIHYVWDGGDSIYLHCAPEGHKLRCLDAESHACLVITGSHRILPQAFSSAYESLVLQGDIKRVTEEKEIYFALQAFLTKYTPDAGEKGKRFLLHMAARTTVLRFHIDSASGKANRA